MSAIQPGMEVVLRTLTVSTPLGPFSVVNVSKDLLGTNQWDVVHIQEHVQMALFVMVTLNVSRDADSLDTSVG